MISIDRNGLSGLALKLATIAIAAIVFGSAPQVAAGQPPARPGTASSPSTASVPLALEGPHRAPAAPVSAAGSQGGRRALGRWPRISA